MKCNPNLIREKVKSTAISDMEDRRVSFASASRKPLLEKRASSPAPSEISRQDGAISGSRGKSKKATGKKDPQSSKGSSNPGSRRGSRRESTRTKDEKIIKEAAANSHGRKESLFKKSDVRYKEIRRHIQKMEREKKKESESGEKQRQEL